MPPALALGLGGALVAGEAAAPFLHLPLFVAAATVCVAAVEAWPPWARARRGGGLLLRLAKGPLQGCGLAALGALLGLALLLACCGAAAALILPQVQAPHLHRLPEPGAGPKALAGAVTSVTFSWSEVAAAGELLLRPVALLPAGPPEPTTVLLLADGQPLVPQAVEFAATRQLVRVPIPPRPLGRLELRRAGGNLPLVFPPGSVVAVEAATRSRLANGVLAALVYLVPAFTALAAATLGAPVLSLPVNLALLLALLLVLTLGELAPTGDAVAALLRGRWLPGEPAFRACLPSLGAGLLLMIAAMPVRRRSRR